MSARQLHSGRRATNPTRRRRPGPPGRRCLSGHTQDDDGVRFPGRRSDCPGVSRGTTTHWFDTGAPPSATAVHLCHEEDGWVGDLRAVDVEPDLIGS